MKDQQDKGGKKPPTTVQFKTHGGNSLFERAVRALGHDGQAMRWMLTSVLETMGTTPEKMTPDELGASIPEVGRRLRQLLLSDQADEAVARLNSALMHWADGG
jgi:hypothetical protein